MTVINITSTIKPAKTIMEIEEILVRFGAKGIIKEYSNSTIDSVSFYIEKNGQRFAFKLPMKIEQARKCVVDAVKNKKLPYKFSNEPLRTEKAEIVGWRIIKDWIRAQLSIYEMQFADPIELLLPYIYDTNEKKTFYEKLMNNPNLLISYKQDEDGD